MPPWSVDVVVTVAVTVATVGPVLADQRPWWIVLIAVVASAPVLLRRRAPVLVLTIVGSALTVLGCVDAMPALPYGTVVSAYTIAAHCSLTWRIVAFIGIGAGILVSLIVPNEQPQAYGYAAMSFVTAWALGTGVRARNNQIALLRERARRLEEERVAAVAQERVRIARDMHDIVTHAVGLMIVQAETGPLLTHSDPDRADATFAGIADTGRDAVRQLRGSIETLRDGTEPRHQPGIAAISDLVELSKRGGLAATFNEYGTPRPISGDIEVTAYRVVQEALTNTMKHAGATCVRVVLRWSDDWLTVRVSDDGHGRGDGLAETIGYGLLGMRERVSACGGLLRDGQSDYGFTVFAELPI
ncbi:MULTISPECIES: sensor histidine kinase [unclassified Nocardia]|uniref:sensor histidine kinase n=1 Tax=unclassified Nocardia TaxID=2637762 RepID=UPI001CE47061|nr:MULTISPECIES: sensor histidine kinase [unclassified Nocardia]